MAVQSGQEEVVWLLLEHRAGVDVKGKREGTALYMAAKNGHEADVDAKESNRRTPLYVATSNVHER